MKYTEATINKELIIEEVLKTGETITEICKRVKIPRCNFYYYKNSDEKFKKDVEAALKIAKEYDLDLAESVVRKQMKENDNLMAAIYTLNNKGGERGYSRLPQKHEKETPIQINIKGIPDGAV